MPQLRRYWNNIITRPDEIKFKNTLVDEVYMYRTPGNASTKELVWAAKETLPPPSKTCKTLNLYTYIKANKKRSTTKTFEIPITKDCGPIITGGYPTSWKVTIIISAGVEVDGVRGSSNGSNGGHAITLDRYLKIINHGKIRGAGGNGGRGASYESIRNGVAWSGNRCHNYNKNAAGKCADNYCNRRSNGMRIGLENDANTLATAPSDYKAAPAGRVYGHWKARWNACLGACSVHKTSMVEIVMQASSGFKPNNNVNFDVAVGGTNIWRRTNVNGNVNRLSFGGTAKKWGTNIVVQRKTHDIGTNAPGICGGYGMAGLGYEYTVHYQYKVGVSGAKGGLAAGCGKSKVSQGTSGPDGGAAGDWGVNGAKGADSGGHTGGSGGTAGYAIRHSNYLLAGSTGVANNDRSHTFGKV